MVDMYATLSDSWQESSKLLLFLKFGCSYARIKPLSKEPIHDSELIQQACRRRHCMKGTAKTQPTMFTGRRLTTHRIHPVTAVRSGLWCEPAQMQHGCTRLQRSAYHVFPEDHVTVQ